MAWNRNANGEPLDSNGKVMTDGRLCYKIVSAENPDMPPIFIYGTDAEQILEKAAKTIESAQGQIHRMRKAPPNPPPPPPAGSRLAPSVDIARAVTDLSNPATAGQAVKTLLKSVGVDVDRQAMVQALHSVALIAEQWERDNPDYPKDPRNDHILMKIAANHAGGNHRIRTEHIDSAFKEAKQHEIFFEPKSLEVPAVTVHPDGNPDSRTVRNATGYPSNRLRGSAPAPAPKGDTPQEAKWRTILEKGNGAALEDAIRNQPGFAEWVDKQFAKKTA